MNNGRPDRIGQVDRRTGETHIRLCLNLDGTGKCQVQTGIGFFDHMINGFTRHGLFDVELNARGDLEVDTHHTVEDTGIVLARLLRRLQATSRGLGGTAL